jgi:hypothetical protein
MKYVTIPETTLETVIDGLQDVLKVCRTAPSDPEKSYPYAVGYSCAALEHIVATIERLKAQAN